MNLIEQLGGYEKAKAQLYQADKLEYELISVPYKNYFADTHKDNLRNDLLQYRRENNIFEVGDKVVRLDNDNPYIYTVQKVEPDLITIVRKKKSNSIKTWGMWHGLNDLRHATDSEAKQGYRDE